MNDFILSSLKKLKQNNIKNPEIDLRILLNHSKYSKNEIILSNFDLKQVDITKFNILLNRRLSNEPISKIINKKNFWKDEFFVNKNVLDPRPESETIIEESLKTIKDKKSNHKILDIGTGSGALAISLAREFINSKIVAIDISKYAIEVANKNIIKKKLQKQITLRHQSFDLVNKRFDLIVSNPPYLSEEELENVSNEIKKFEPKIALDGGSDGLFFYRKFAKKIPKIMNKNGILIIEIGYSQFDACEEIFQSSPLKLIKKVKDLQKKDRIMVLSKI